MRIACDNSSRLSKDLELACVVLGSWDCPFFLCSFFYLSRSLSLSLFFFLCFFCWVWEKGQKGIGEKGYEWVFLFGFGVVLVDDGRWRWVSGESFFRQT